MINGPIGLIRPLPIWLSARDLVCMPIWACRTRPKCYTDGKPKSELFDFRHHPAVIGIVIGVVLTIFG